MKYEAKDKKKDELEQRNSPSNYHKAYPEMTDFCRDCAARNCA